jgi:hypothetical protein
VVDNGIPFSFFTVAETTNFREVGNFRMVKEGVFESYADIPIDGHIIVWNQYEGPVRREARNHELLTSLNKELYDIGKEIAKRTKDKKLGNSLKKDHYAIRGIVQSFFFFLMFVLPLLF